MFRIEGSGMSRSSIPWARNTGANAWVPIYRTGMYIHIHIRITHRIPFLIYHTLCKLYAYIASWASRIPQKALIAHTSGCAFNPKP